VKNASTLRQWLSLVQDQAVSEGRMHWRPEDIVDRPLTVGAMRATVRCIPTFAERRVAYDTGIASRQTCYLCAARDDSLDSGAGARWARSYDLVWWLNEFPYFPGHALIGRRAHGTLFSRRQLEGILELVGSDEIRSFAYQTPGSGATVFDHDHVSVFDEELPLCRLPVSRLAVDPTTCVELAVARGYPGTVFVVRLGSLSDRLALALEIIGWLAKSHCSYNLYGSRVGAIWVVPRTRRRSESLGRKVGATMAAGIYIGYPSRRAAASIPALIALMEQECAEMTSEVYGCALRDTVFQGDPEELLAPLLREWQTASVEE
jgi:hypothetical protein